MVCLFPSTDNLLTIALHFHTMAVHKHAYTIRTCYVRNAKATSGKERLWWAFVRKHAMLLWSTSQFNEGYCNISAFCISCSWSSSPSSLGEKVAQLHIRFLVLITIEPRPLPLHSNTQGGRMRIPIFSGKGVFFSRGLGNISRENTEKGVCFLYSPMVTNTRDRGYVLFPR